MDFQPASRPLPVAERCGHRTLTKTHWRSCLLARVVFPRTTSTKRFRISSSIGRRPGRDFHFRNNRSARRCQPIKVAGLTTRRADLHAKMRDQKTNQSRAAFVSSCGRIGCSWFPQAPLPRKNLRCRHSALTAKRRYALTTLFLLRHQPAPLRPRFRPVLSHPSRVQPRAPANKMRFR